MRRACVLLCALQSLQFALLAHSSCSHSPRGFKQTGIASRIATLPQLVASLNGDREGAWMELQRTQEIHDQMEDVSEVGPLKFEIPTEAMIMRQQQWEQEVASRVWDAQYWEEQEAGGSRANTEGVLAARSRSLLIAEGSPATTSMYPFVAMVLRPGSGKYLCAGTLVHPRVVLTAAHCVVVQLDGSENPTVNLKRDGLSQRTGYQQFATKSIVNPKFHPGSFDYDVAALILPNEAEVKPATLVMEGQTLGNKSEHGSNSELIVMGWGATQKNVLAPWLLFAEVEPISKAECQQLFKPFGSKVTPRMTCVTGRTCAGDSGGPLLLLPDGLPPGSSNIKAPVGGVIRGSGLPGSSTVKPATNAILVGQVSFGFPRDQGQGCPDPNPATVFTDLANTELQQWLKTEIFGKALNEGVPAASGNGNQQGWSEDSLATAQEQLAPRDMSTGTNRNGLLGSLTNQDNGLLDVLWDIGPFSRH